MARVVVVGHPTLQGPLPCAEFAQMLASRLGVQHLPFALRDPAERVFPDEATHWVVSEPAGAFTEHVFRQADVVVWLHFSPTTFLSHWIGALRGQLARFARAAAGYAHRADWRDIVTALGYRMVAGDMYRLFAHPALAHVRVVELRTPGEAEFWLLAQRRAAGHAAQDACSAA
ncbi:MAG TPA: hypothetical protein VFR86_01670 [Burkholderiaceae bacterium]|nr:hypothetical protein [Burkholderiaceae bacterium]